MATPVWQQVDVAGVPHWCDVAGADAWIATAVRQSSAVDDQTFDKADWSAQQVACLNPWRAIANVYRYANIPPYSDPIIRQKMALWFGRTTPYQDDVGGSLAGRVKRLLAGYPSGTGGVVGDRIRQIWTRRGNPPMDAGHPLCNIRVRISLGSDATVTAWCVGGTQIDDAANPGCNFANFLSGQLDTERMVPLPNSSAYDWNTLSWHAGPPFGLAAGPSCTFADCLPPLHWFREIARDIALAMQARGGAGPLLAESMLYALASDVVAARAAGVLPASLAAASDAIPQTINALSWNNDARTAAQHGLALASAVPYVGFLAGLANAIYSAFPSATGVNVDDVGRAMVTANQESAWNFFDLDPHAAANGAPPAVDADDIAAARSTVPIGGIDDQGNVVAGDASSAPGASVNEGTFVNTFAATPRTGKITVSHFTPNIPQATGLPPGAVAPAAQKSGILAWIEAHPYEAATLGIAGAGVVVGVFSLLGRRD